MKPCLYCGEKSTHIFQRSSHVLLPSYLTEVYVCDEHARDERRSGHHATICTNGVKLIGGTCGDCA